MIQKSTGRGGDRKLQAVFFDFDGVVLNSVQVKTEAFAHMFRPYGPDIEAAVVAYHLEHGGVSRFEKFRYFYDKLLRLPLVESELQVLGNEFSSLVLSKVLAADFIPGCLETLRELKRLKVPAFVVSGTPEYEMLHIVESRKLNEFFDEIHGAPRSKSEILADILSRFGFLPKTCWFLGDAMTDWRAARECGVNFLGIVPEGEPSPFPPATKVASQILFPFDR